MTEQDFLKAQKVQEDKAAQQLLLERMEKAEEEQGFEIVAFLTFGPSNYKVDFDEIISDEEILKIRQKLIASVKAKIAQLQEEFADI